MAVRHITNNLMDGPRAVAAVTRIGMIAYLLLTTIMWGNNVWGKMELNFGLVIISFLGVLYTGVSPMVTVPWLGLYTLSPAAAQEVKQVMFKFLFSFMLIAVFLATWSFKASPWSFWALFALLSCLLMWQLVHKSEFDGFSKKLQLGYILICIALVLLKTMGVDLASKVDASTIENAAAGIGCMSTPTSVVSSGARLTVDSSCPTTIDQRRMTETGVDFVLVDPELRATIGRSQLVSFEQELGSNIVTLIPNRAAFERLGLESVEIEVYPRGTGAEEVARRHGIHVPAIDLTPAE